MKDFFEVKSEKDYADERSLILDNDNKMHIKRTDPYGFWYMNLDKGCVPDELRGAYTSFDIAYKEAKKYLEGKRRTIVSEKLTEK